MSVILGYLITIYGFFGILIYAFFLMVFVSNYKTHFSNIVFYQYIPSLAVGDSGRLLVNSVYLLTYQLLPDMVTGGVVYHRLVFEWQILTYNISVLITLLIAFNRYAAFMAPRWNEILMRKHAIRYTIACTYVIALLFLVGLSSFCRCSYEFEPTFAVLKPNCRFLFGAEPQSQNLTALERDIRNVAGNPNLDNNWHLVLFIAVGLMPCYLAVVIIALYIRCFIHIIHLRKTPKKMFREKIQAQMARAKTKTPVEPSSNRKPVSTQKSFTENNMPTMLAVRTETEDISNDPLEDEYSRFVHRGSHTSGKMKQRKFNHKMEFNFLLQGGLISLAMICSDLVFQLEQFVHVGAAQIMAITHSVLTPLIFLALNGTVRKCAVKMLKLKTNGDRVPDSHSQFEKLP